MTFELNKDEVSLLRLTALPAYGNIRETDRILLNLRALGLICHSRSGKWVRTEAGHQYLQWCDED